MERETDVVLISDIPLGDVDARVLQVASVKEVPKDCYITMEYFEPKQTFRLCTSEGEKYEYQCSKKDLSECINGLTGIIYCDGLIGLDFATITEEFGETVTGEFHCLKTSSKSFQQDLKQASWFQKQGNIKNLLFTAVGEVTLMNINDIAAMCEECWGEECEVIMQGNYEEREDESFWVGVWVNG